MAALAMAMAMAVVVPPGDFDAHSEFVSDSAKSLGPAFRSESESSKPLPRRPHGRLTAARSRTSSRHAPQRGETALKRRSGMVGGGRRQGECSSKYEFKTELCRRALWASLQQQHHHYYRQSM